MNILLLGAAGFIGTNLTLKLAEKQQDHITLVDRSFFHVINKTLRNIRYIEQELTIHSDFMKLVQGQDVVYHLVSTTIPSTSNEHISQGLIANVVLASNLLDACVRDKVKKVVFISSGGTVYGKGSGYPLKEEDATNPINSYGVQKVTIEKLLYLYQYLYDLDYRVIRLANPYGPYQDPNGILGAVTTFTYKAMRNEKIIVYGDGTVVRDFIYIDDAVRGMMKIANGESPYRIYNLGCGHGTSIKEVLHCIEKVLNLRIHVEYASKRRADVPVNYLDISRYEETYGKLNPLSLEEGIKKTAEFMKEQKMV